MKKAKSTMKQTKRSSDSITLEDVARLAGVSTITVSRALNYPEKVASTTLENVNRAISQTGYVPNLLAGGLASKKTKLIAAIIPSITNSVYAETIQHFSSYLREAGYQVILGESGYPEQNEQKLITTILSRKPDGLLLTGVNHSKECRKFLLGAKIPLVETWELTQSPLDIAVGFSHEQVGVAVGSYVTNKGIKQVGSVCANDRRAKIREQAMCDELKRRGIDDIKTAEVSAPTNLQSGRAGFSQLLQQGFRNGIVCCSSDTVAHGVLIEAQARGIRVPYEISILGFGDQNFASETYPAISTVRVDRSKIGLLAAETLLARIDEKAVEKTIIDVGFEIVERQTT